jgi:hypothetical protein
MSHPIAISKANAGRVGPVVKLDQHSDHIYREHCRIDANVPRAAVVVADHRTDLEVARVHGSNLPRPANPANWNRKAIL